MYGWVIGKNVELELQDGWIYENRRGYSFAANLMNKFPGDIINLCAMEKDYFLDGYVANRREMMEQVKTQTWEKAFETIWNDGDCLKPLRGSFCGFVYSHAADEITVFSDHMGTRAVYYYCQDGKAVVASNMVLLVDALKKNNVIYHFDENAAQYMLTYGYMLDDTTFIKEVKRVLPGQMVCLNEKGIQKNSYYRMSNEPIKECTMEEAVEKIDAAFRKAVKREFDKDREYGYRHLVDLSGGLDSRMVCWVAHEMGYTDQVNFTYCRNGYLDYSISQKIAMDLKHEYLFKPLDDAGWMYDVDEIVKMNNGAALYHGITGGKRLLEILNGEKFGIEHTGMIGDVILGSYFKDESIAYGKPNFGYLRYSDSLKCDFDDSLLDDYPNQELFTLFTRGILGAASTYMIRQNYFETSSPFMDVDFVEICLSLPFCLRREHNIYLEWMNRKYPQAAEYGWEKWGGVKPKKKHVKYRKVVTAFRLSDIYMRKALGRAEKNHMNPLDYWFGRDLKLQKFYDEYFKQNFERDEITDSLKSLLLKLFQNGNVYEKGMVLTVLGAIKILF